MRKTKKILAALIVVSMLSLSSCGTDSSGIIVEKDTSSITEAVSSEEASSTETVTTEITTTEASTTEATTTEKKIDESSYLLPDSDSRFITKEDLYAFDAKECMLARNEIFARNGRKFSDDEVRAYFESQSWYKGTIEPADFNESSLNKYEQTNIATIIEYEEEMGYRAKKNDQGNSVNSSGSGFLLPNSDRLYVTEQDLFGFDARQCSIARNEIYARHGRIFSDSELNQYFNQQSWYRGTILPENFDEVVLNDYEMKNIDTIMQYEKSMGYR